MTDQPNSSNDLGEWLRDFRIRIREKLKPLDNYKLYECVVALVKDAPAPSSNASELEARIEQLTKDLETMYEVRDGLARDKEHLTRERDELECKLNRILSLQEQEGFKEDDQTLAEIFLICRESEQ